MSRLIRGAEYIFHTVAVTVGKEFRPGREHRQEWMFKHRRAMRYLRCEQGNMRKLYIFESVVGGYRECFTLWQLREFEISLLSLPSGMKDETTANAQGTPAPRKTIKWRGICPGCKKKTMHMLLDAKIGLMRCTKCGHTHYETQVERKRKERADASKLFEGDDNG